MKKLITIISILFAFLAFNAQAQDYSQTRKNSNVWVNECKTCHPSYQELAKQAGIQTEQYYFNFIFSHKNKEGKEFRTVLSKSEISFVARFILIAAYLHKLETDMRKAGDHLQKNIKL
tara:strand:- start:646 stop:999 length:354 start_codon:yes stop_codon:yes gene_type:complete